MHDVRWGLIGCGDIAEKRVAPALRAAEGSTLAAVARARADLASAFAARHGADRWHADWRELVRDPAIDAVYVATPVRLHAEQAVAAAEAGKHVLCEKPMALDVAACDRMLAAARRSGVRLGVAYYRHHYPVVARVRALLAAGELGQPVFAQAQAFEPFDPPPGHPRSWLLNRTESGGGPMADFGCHRVEILLDLLGGVDHVYGFASNVRYREREVEDTCVAHFAFANGARAVLSVSHAAYESRDTLEVYGTHGSAQIPFLNAGTLTVVTASGRRTEEHPPHLNLHQPLIQDFVDAVRGGREPAVTGGVGRRVASAIAAIYAGG